MMVNQRLRLHWPMCAKVPYCVGNWDLCVLTGESSCNIVTYGIVEDHQW